MWCCTACDSAEDAVEITKTPVVAAVAESMSAIAARDYCNEKAYDIEELFSLTDCAFAVESGKYDYLVCNDLEKTKLQDFNLVYVEDCAYKSQYSLCFDSDYAGLCQQFNSAISALNEDGTIEKILNSYMGGDKYSSQETVGNPIYIMFVEGAEEYFDMNDDGEAVGLEIDIVTALCNKLGCTPVFVNGEYDESFDALVNGEADLIMAVDSTNAALGEDFILSTPYLTVNYGVYGTPE